MFDSGRLKELTNRLETLETQLDLLRLEWKDWRKQLVKAAARLERAEERAGRREPDGNGGSPGGGEGETEELRRQRLNSEIIARRGGRRAVLPG